VTATVTDIDVDRDRSVTVRFDDGVEHRFELVELRAACPCASCRARREQGEVAWPRPGVPSEIAVADAELVGAWGISFRWSDGHGTGIYPWDSLHRWAMGERPGIVDESSPDETAP
jgi:DUF971 family protein